MEKSSDEVRIVILRAMESEEARNNVPYDGVLGHPPGWAPEWAVKFFISYRNRLLDVRGCPHKYLIEWVGRYTDEYLEEKENPNGLIPPPEYPNGKPTDDFCFLDEIGFLAWLKWCVDQGEKEGGKRLGRGLSELARSGAEEKNRLNKEARIHCIHEADAIWKAEKKRGDEVTRIGAMCKMLLDDLNNKGMWVPKTDTRIRGWLSEADRIGNIIIPPEARKAGRTKR